MYKLKLNQWSNPVWFYDYLHIWLTDSKADEFFKHFCHKDQRISNKSPYVRYKWPEKSITEEKMVMISSSDDHII